MARLSAEEIRRAFTALADELRRAGARAEIAVAGGAALVLLYGARESTRDVDAITLDLERQELHDSPVVGGTSASVRGRTPLGSVYRPTPCAASPPAPDTATPRQ